MNGTVVNGTAAPITKESDELVEKEIRDRFKKMCEGYFESVSKKLVMEHNVSRGRTPVRHRGIHDYFLYRGCKSKIGEIMRRTSAQARSSRIDSKRTRR